MELRRSRQSSASAKAHSHGARSADAVRDRAGRSLAADPQSAAIPIILLVGDLSDPARVARRISSRRGITQAFPAHGADRRSAAGADGERSPGPDIERCIGRATAATPESHPLSGHDDKAQNRCMSAQSPASDDLLRRVRNEFRDMPGLRLTARPLGSGRGWLRGAVDGAGGLALPDSHPRWLLHAHRLGLAVKAPACPRATSSAA